MIDKDLLFITGLFPREFEKEIIENSKGNIQNAANVLQWNILEGLNNNFSGNMNILNSIYIGDFPLTYKKLWIKTFPFTIDGNDSAINVGFMNLIFIKHFTRYYSLRKKIKQWCIDGNTEKVVLAYALTNVNLWCFKYIKKINPSIKTCIIVPDLPEYMSTSNKKKTIYSFLKKISVQKIYKDSQYIDKFIYITESMREKFPSKPYIVIEGIANFNNEVEIDKKVHEHKIIMYSGTLNEKYGILNLLKAFNKIDNSTYRLVICGDGDSKDKVIEASQNDNRIVYKGLLPRNEVLKIQREATALINPRMNVEDFCKYSFPSKILEYLSSGVPVIGYKLAGVPSEYDDFIYYIEENTTQSMSKKIIEVCEKNPVELQQFSMRAFNFIKENKNKDYQTKKIIDFIS